MAAWRDWGDKALERRVAVPVALVFLAFCVVLWTWGTLNGTIGYAGLVRDPASYDGQSVTLSLVDVRQVEADHYVVGKGSLRLRVDGPTAGLSLGDEVDVGGTWSGDRRALRQEWREVAVGRGGKRQLGFIGLAVAFVILGVGLRRAPGGLALRG